MRFYGFRADEIVNAEVPQLDLAVDPKLAWALRNRDVFPLDLNCAPREMLLRIPGVGARSVDRMLASRRHRRLRFDDLRRLHIALERAMPFVVVDDFHPGQGGTESAALRQRMRARTQLDLFGAITSARTGEL
jgi:predicted DNA-binding helix-hairpin-helix protein